MTLVIANLNDNFYNYHQIANNNCILLIISNFLLKLSLYKLHIINKC